MKAKSLVFKKTADFWSAPTIDGVYAIYAPGAIHNPKSWALQFRDEFGVYGTVILLESFESVQERCEELHQQSFAELIEFWGAP